MMGVTKKKGMVLLVGEMISKQVHYDICQLVNFLILHTRNQDLGQLFPAQLLQEFLKGVFISISV